MGNNKRALIICAAPESDYDYIIKFLEQNKDCYIVAADGGIDHARAMGLKVDFIVGDFDSAKSLDFDEPIMRLPTEKDDTDTMQTLKEVANKGYKDITIVCATTGRLDHTLSNLFLLEKAEQMGIDCSIMDSQNIITLHSGGIKIFQNNKEFKYFSIIPMDRILTDVTIQGAKYNINNVDLKRDNIISVSNECVENQFIVQIGTGKAFVILSKDK